MGSKRKKAFEPSLDQKSHAPALVVYELQMFLYSLRAWPLDFSILHTWLGQLLRNSRRETTLVHARILIDFFEPRPNSSPKDDVRSADMGFPAKAIPGGESLRNDINKRATHLTYTRTKFQDDLEKKSWSPDIFDPLLLRCSEFLHADKPNEFVARHASPEVRAVWNDLIALTRADPFGSVLDESKVSGGFV